jgi:hypothetical protein
VTRLATADARPSARARLASVLEQFAEGEDTADIRLARFFLARKPE